MKLLTLFFSPSPSPPAEACKCLGKKGHNNVQHTHKCCNQLDGSFQGGNDCEASSISEHLREFRACARTTAARPPTATSRLNLSQSRTSQTQFMQRHP
ncbi:uncharacterized protein BXZ73DRAFT_105593 [Epithele typhae]|uniref:uncharacterized protein n=1 Tax=Epithele typhae TaxID=378194 RepID=UPI0020088FF9|nr:uncharacterized protein BXZ73DRAFT_105593 [Epithele typhae]KAH9917115.1 hypothetical protein BXZ73DRAFT_105593 [Epithele typhae]